MATNDPDFTIVKKHWSYENLPELIGEAVPGFTESPEYEELLENDLDELPGIVLGALRRFLLRLQQDAESLDEKWRRALCSGHEVINQLATKSKELREAVVVEVYEPLNPSERKTKEFYLALRPAARELYEERCRIPPG